MSHHLHGQPGGLDRLQRPMSRWQSYAVPGRGSIVHLGVSAVVGRVSPSCRETVIAVVGAPVGSRAWASPCRTGAASGIEGNGLGHSPSSRVWVSSPSLVWPHCAARMVMEKYIHLDDGVGIEAAGHRELPTGVAHRATVIQQASWLRPGRCWLRPLRSCHAARRRFRRQRPSRMIAPLAVVMARSLLWQGLADRRNPIQSPTSNRSDNTPIVHTSASKSPPALPPGSVSCPRCWPAPGRRPGQRGCRRVGSTSRSPARVTGSARHWRRGSSKAIWYAVRVVRASIGCSFSVSPEEALGQ